MMSCQQWENDTHRLRIEYEADPSNPRDDDNVWTLIAWHRRYTLGDSSTAAQYFSDPEHFWTDLYAYVTKGSDGVTEDTRDDNTLQAWAAAHVVVRPLYLYDHSSLDLSTRPFQDPWDSGAVGYAFITRDQILKEWGDTPESLAAAESCLAAELRLYTDYLNGETTGFIYERKIRCDHGDWHYDEENACWGFYGSDPQENGMTEYWDDAMMTLAGLAPSV